jgi:hypothetical protein
MKKAIVILALIIISCAGTLIKSPYSDPIVYNQEYYNEVRAHFEKLGIKMNEEELIRFKTRIFIVTVPPICEIYDDGLFIGKSNVDNLYFKPGKRILKLRKDNITKEFKVEFLEGANLRLVLFLKGQYGEIK